MIQDVTAMNSLSPTGGEVMSELHAQPRERRGLVAARAVRVRWLPGDGRMTSGGGCWSSLPPGKLDGPRAC